MTRQTPKNDRQASKPDTRTVHPGRRNVSGLERQALFHGAFAGSPHVHARAVGPVAELLGNPE